MDERHPVIKPRRVSFDWTKTPLHYIPGDPVATHIYNCFHLMLPAGEKWFIACVKDALPEVTDPRLREEIRGFIGQEMVHARSHQAVLEGILERHGIDVRPLTAGTEKMVAERPAKRATMKARTARRWLMFELAVVAANEHYTAVLGQWIMDNKTLDAAGVDPVMLDLLRWHGAEEVEHRSVVYDVFHHLGGTYRMRVAAFLFALAMMAYGIWPGTMQLLRQDPAIKGRVTFPRVFLGTLRGVRRGTLPSLTRLCIREPLLYLRRSHHPSQVAHTQQALDYLSTSPAATDATDTS